MTDDFDGEAHKVHLDRERVHIKSKTKQGNIKLFYQGFCKKCRISE